MFNKHMIMGRNSLPPFSARVRFQSFFSNQTLEISIEIPYETWNVIQ